MQVAPDRFVDLSQILLDRGQLHLHALDLIPLMIYVPHHSLMHRVLEPGKVANWIAAPRRGINGMPVEYEYVRG